MPGGRAGSGSRGPVNNKRYYELLGVAQDADDATIKKVCLAGSGQLVERVCPEARGSGSVGSWHAACLPHERGGSPHTLGSNASSSSSNRAAEAVQPAAAAHPRRADLPSPLTCAVPNCRRTARRR